LCQSVKDIWELVDETVQSRPLKKPVCVVGAPGIGKSTTFAYLMKKLLSEGKTVTYLKRTETQHSHFIQMIPKDGGNPVVKVYPEASQVSLLPTMRDPEAYLLVDSGKTKTSCDWSEAIEAKLVINASPDSRHWGENEFVKSRSQQRLAGGVLLYLPPYSLPELLVVVPLLVKGATVESIMNGFYFFGGSLRLITAGTSVQKAFKDKQADEVSHMPAEVVSRIIRGTDAVDFSRNGPSSAVVSLEPTREAKSSTDQDNDKDRSYNFHRSRAIPQSRFVLDQIADRAEDDLWSAVLADRHDSWMMLEQFLRLQLQKPEQASYTVRRSVGKSNPAFESSLHTMKVGGCAGSEMVVDMVKFIKTMPVEDNGRTKLLYSCDRLYPLFDMIYREGEGVYHAFNATVSGTKKVLPKKFSDEVKAVAEELDLANNPDHKVFLYYSTPTDNFDDFFTSSREPPIPKKFCKQFEIYNCHIQKA